MQSVGCIGGRGLNLFVKYGREVNVRGGADRPALIQRWADSYKAANVSALFYPVWSVAPR